MDMIFITLKKDGVNCDAIHFDPFNPVYGVGKTEEELKREGFLLEKLPERETVPGKEWYLKYDKDKGEFYYEYVEWPGLSQVTK